MKKKLTQLNHKGLSGGYNNEIGYLYTPLSIFMDEKVSEENYRKLFKLNETDYIFKNVKKLMTYSQRYPSEIFENVLNKNNQSDINHIDELVIEINSYLDNESTDVKKLYDLLDEVHFTLNEVHLYEKNKY